MGAVESFQGKAWGETTDIKNKGSVTQQKGGVSRYEGGDAQEETLLVLQQGAYRTFPEGPCQGCGSLFQHRSAFKPSLSQESVPKVHTGHNINN